jgi:hypothetical protein
MRCDSSSKGAKDAKGISHIQGRVNQLRVELLDSFENRKEVVVELMKTRVS